MLQLINIKKDYKTSGSTVQALKGVDLRFRKNEFVSILGPSGCGKTTLLNIIGGLDQYTSGDLIICGKSTKAYKDHDWDAYRNHRIGFVFQSYNLIPHQTILGNVEIALTISGVSKTERRRRAKEALEKVGLKDEIHKKPNQLSGGQMQRVAIARALVNNPEILLADEPTGALDTKTSVQIMELIREIAGERLVIMVTHNPELAEEYSSRIVRLQDGLLVSDTNPYYGEEKEEIVEEALPETAAEEAKPTISVNESAEEKIKRLKVQIKAERKAQRLAEKQAKKEQEKSSMSFLTSLGLSARNLLMKKGRTIVTSIAGSIGIVSVCLVLALSNGFNNYIMKTQEDMLSSSPLTISDTSLDITSIFAGLNSAGDIPELSEVGDNIYVNSFMTNIAKGLTVTNNISQEYVNYLEEADAHYEAIVYNTGMSLMNSLYTEVELVGDSGMQKSVISLAEMRDYYSFKLSQQDAKYAALGKLVSLLGDMHGKMPGTANVNDKSFGAYVKSQYDVIAGEFPKSVNEAVLVIGGGNDIVDVTLAQLGIISEEQFLSLFPAEGQEAEDVPDMLLPYDTILNKTLMLNYNDAIYERSSDGNYVYDYVGRRTQFDLGEENGREIKITAILRLKKGMNYGCLSGGMSSMTGGVFLTEQLYNEVNAINAQSKIVKTLNKQVTKMQEFTQKFKELSSSADPVAAYMEIVQMLSDGESFVPAAKTVEGEYTSVQSLMEQTGATNGEISMNDAFKNVYFLYGDSAIRKVGGLETPSSVQIYARDFASKEALLNHLDTWNDTHDESEQVKYSDTVGTMLGMVETILDVITYVLVAFTAISLVVSSVMIGIITYVSVVERVKEIGVLRSLGARKKDIKNLFNAETFIIGLASGLIGVSVCYLIAFIVNLILEGLTGIASLATLPVISALMMITISVVLTLISGLIPANAAAKKDPVVALRTE